MKFYPDNKASHYTTRLPQDVNLTGEYEVGLSEIMFSNTFFNINKGDCLLTYIDPNPEAPIGANHGNEYRGPVEVKMKIPEGLYESNEYFIQNVNIIFRKAIDPLHKHQKSKVKFYYNRATKKAKITIYEAGGMLRMSPAMQRILGMESDTIVGPTHKTGQFIMDLNEGMKSIYVYCDITRSRQVGDTMAPLLRIIPIKDHKEHVVYHTFDKPHYVPLSRPQFNTVEVLLTNDTGKTIAFSSGSVIATLHFRRTRPDYY